MVLQAPWGPGGDFLAWLEAKAWAVWDWLKGLWRAPLPRSGVTGRHLKSL